jgi:WD40 repeat protein
MHVRFALLAFAFGAVARVGFASEPAPQPPVKDAYGDPLPEGAKARLGTVRGGPGITAALFSPKYDAFLYCFDRRVNLHDAATGKLTEVAVLPYERAGSVVAISADSKRALLHSLGTYTVIEVPTGKVVRTIRGTLDDGWRSVVSLSGDGKLCAYDASTRGKDSKQEVAVYGVDTDREVTRVSVLQNSYVSALLSPDGKTLATFGNHNERDPNPAPGAVHPACVVQVWDVTTGKQLGSVNNPGDPFGVTTATFAPDGKTLATSTGRGGISLWDIPACKLKETLLGRSTQAEKIAFAPDGKTLAAVDQLGAVERWTLPDGKPLKLTEFPGAAFRTGGRTSHPPIQYAGLGFTDNDRVVAWGWWVLGQMVAWEAPSGKMLTPVAGHLGGVTAVGFAANGRDVISTGGDGRVVRWDTATGRSNLLTHLFTFDDGIPSDRSARVGPGSRGLRISSVYDLEVGTEAFRLPVVCAFPSPDFTHALGVESSRDRKETTCSIWNLNTRKKVSMLELPARVEERYPDMEMAAAFSPDNSRLVTAVTVRTPNANERTVVTGWDVKTGRKLSEFAERAGRYGASVAAADNGGAVLATSDGKLWVANYEKGFRGAELDDVPRRGTEIRCPTFSPNGKLLAAGIPTEKVGEHAVRIYDWQSGKILHTFTGHRGRVTALAFSPDGKTLASGSADTTVLLWDVSKVN